MDRKGLPLEPSPVRYFIWWLAFVRVSATVGELSTGPK